ncbi:6-bladed beta-propeller [Algoriphagus aquimarinus]|uniref:6-bladed beta-propeller n=1 Tax=Algoriphagus aquimarinus TaxID=237018 RepID=UPI0030DC1681|tara:strand:- start:88967 stop:90187 length:1221 start_codon:yes stop_codon:yes gene_type:complete
MKQSNLFLLILICSIFASCSSGDKADSDQLNDGLEIIKVDLSEAREGKLSEFFAPEIEYIWLKDDVEGGLIGNGLQKIFFHEDKVFTLDLNDCKCIKIFDKSGDYLSIIRAFGEGPEKYLELGDAAIVNGEVLLSGIHPPKLMWFSLDGNFLREEKLAKHLGSTVFSEEAKRYYFSSFARGPGEHFVESVDESFQDTLKFFSFENGRYYSSTPLRYSFKKNENSIYFGRGFNDTILELKEGNFVPKLIFEFGEYAQSNEEMKSIKDNLSAKERMDFINNKAKLYFSPHSWYINDSQFLSNFKYEEGSYNVFFDRKNQISHVTEGRLKNDIDQSYDPYSFTYQFSDGKTGSTIPGKTLFKILQKKKESLGQEAFEEYVKGKGKNFAQAAFAAKDSENPVLIVYTVKN